VAHRHELVAAGVWALLALLAGTALGLIAGASRRRPMRWHGWVVLVAVQLALTFALATVPLSMLWVTYYYRCHPWQDTAHLRTRGGPVFHVQQYEQWDVLSEEVGKDRFFLRTRVVGATKGSRDGMPLVRPTGAAAYQLPWSDWYANKNTGKVIESQDGRWVLFAFAYAYTEPLRGLPRLDRLECRTTLAYDLRSGRVYAGKTLAKLSPFILVGPRDALDDDDVKALRELRRYDFSIGKLYEFDAVAQGTKHPNPAVRRLAAQMLGEFWDAKDDAMAVLTKLARDDPDAAVRKAAYWARRALVKRVEERRRGAS
jgi:hypothetical protein